MLGLWESVLGRPLGLRDHLFEDLGANSLQVLELLELVLDEFGVSLSVDQLLVDPTPAGFVSMVTSGRAE